MVVALLKSHAFCGLLQSSVPIAAGATYLVVAADAIPGAASAAIAAAISAVHSLRPVTLRAPYWPRIRAVNHW